MSGYGDQRYPPGHPHYQWDHQHQPPSQPNLPQQRYSPQPQTDAHGYVQPFANPVNHPYRLPPSRGHPPPPPHPPPPQQQHSHSFHHPVVYNDYYPTHNINIHRGISFGPPTAGPSEEVAGLPPAMYRNVLQDFPSTSSATSAQSAAHPPPMQPPQPLPPHLHQEPSNRIPSLHAHSGGYVDTTAAASYPTHIEKGLHPAQMAAMQQPPPDNPSSRQSMGPPPRPPLPSPEELQGMASSMFKRFDQDRTNYLELPEFMDALRALHVGVTYDEILERFKMADEDRDGRISESEFIQIYVGFRQQVGRAPPQRF